MRKFKLSLLSTLIVLATFLTACGDGQVEENPVEETEVIKEEKLKLYTTIYPLQFFAEQIGGDLVEVTNIIPVGSDAHSYEPTAKTMTDITDGDLFIYNGAGMEGFVEAILSVLEKEDVKVVKAVEDIELHESTNNLDEHTDVHDDHKQAHDDHGEEEHGHEEHGNEEEIPSHDVHNHGAEDPHAWLDPIIAIQMAEKIKFAMIDLLPEGEAVFQENYESLKSELEALDTEFRLVVEQAEKDRFIVSHAGYGYWEDRYGIHQIGVSGISPSDEPTIKDIENIIELAKEIGVQYIAFEQNIPTGNAETVKKEANLDVVYIHNLESLMKEDQENNEDYFSLMRKNIDSLEQLLQ